MKYKRHCDSKVLSAKFRKLRLGSKWTPEQRVKILTAVRGKKRSKEFCERTRQNTLKFAAARRKAILKAYPKIRYNRKLSMYYEVGKPKKRIPIPLLIKGIAIIRDPAVALGIK